MVVAPLGTRLALGASRGDIVAPVMRQAALIAAAGLAIGVLGGLAAARALPARLDPARTLAAE